MNRVFKTKWSAAHQQYVVILKVVQNGHDTQVKMTF